MFKKIRNKVNSMVATAKATVATKKAEGYVDSGVKILIAVVIRETEQQLNEFPQEILCFDFNIFDKLVDKVIMISKEELVFELRCEIKLREAIQWN